MKCHMSSSQIKRQRLIFQQGSTLIGIVIGLVIGLAVALAVSLYMKRADMPFVKRDQLAKSDVDRAAGRDAAPVDPNESLYSKPRAADSRPALADVVPGRSNDPAGTKSAESRNLNIDKMPAERQPLLIDKNTGDPLGKLAERVAREPAAKAPSVVAGVAPPGANGLINPNDDGSRYLIQAGAFKQPEDAETMRAKLAMLGFEAKISQRETDAGTIHRVRIGPVPDLEMTNRARSKLAENGVESSIIKIK